MKLENSGISKQVLEEIIDLAKAHNISKVVLFGSKPEATTLKKVTLI